MSKYSKLLVCIVIIIISFNYYNCFGQSFNSIQSINIPDNNSVSYPIIVSGISSQIDTTQFGLESVSFTIEHEDNSQLTIYLESPSGKSILLLKKLPGSNFSGTELNGTSSIYIDFGENSYNKKYRSIHDLSLLNNSENPNGEWKLVVEDDESGGVGKINGATLLFGNEPAKPILSTSDLPIIIINTNGIEINNSTKLLSDMKIIYNGEGKWNSINDPDTHFNGKIAIKIRGSSSQRFPKKQYGFDTMDDEGIDDIKVSLLGMPKESDWILSAIYQDKTIMRNPFTYQIARELGSYAARTVYCEVIINDEYRGVYVFQEKIKRDKNRVDVEKLSGTDIADPNVTGGYIFKLDGIDDDEIYWRSKIPDPTGIPTAFIYVYPKKAADLQIEQRNYIESYVNSFEESLLRSDFTDIENGYRNYIDEYSFINYFIITELSSNIDGYRKSAYFYKKRQGKLEAGPVWDYDLAWGNANYFDGESTTGYRYTYGYPADDYRVPFWWGRMMADPLWKQNMVCLYRSLRNSILSKEHLFGIVDSLYGAINLGQQRNFIRWDISGKYVSTNPRPVAADYEGDVEKLKSFISNRLDFLDNDLGICSALNITLLNFNATNLKNEVKLNWLAETDEHSRAYFEIQRATAGESFKKIGQIEAINSTGTEKLKSPGKSCPCRPHQLFCKG